MKTVNIRCSLENFVKEDHLEIQEKVQEEFGNKGLEVSLS